MKDELIKFQGQKINKRSLINVFSFFKKSVQPLKEKSVQVIFKNIFKHLFTNI